MLNDKLPLINNLFSNINVNLTVSEFTHCPDNWKDIDYIPEYNKFYYILDGEGMVKIDNDKYYPKSGQMVLMPAGVKQSYSTISSTTYTKYWCHFTAIIGELRLFNLIKTPFIIDVKDSNKLEKLFKNLIAAHKDSSITSILKTKSILLEIISFFLDNCSINRITIVKSGSINKLNKFFDYIENNLDKNFKIDELAEMLHFHPNYFIRFFKKHAGTTPIQYICNLRLEKARTLLLKDLTITQIAEKTGYSDVYHFSRIFKLHTGFSPTDYRRHMLKIF